MITKNPPKEVCPATTLKITRYLHDEMKCTTRMWQVDAWMLKLVLDFSHSMADFFLQISELFLANVPCKTYTLEKKEEKNLTYRSVFYRPKRCVQDIILGFQMFHRGRSSDKMTIRFSLISSVSKNITSTLLHWYFALWGNIFHIIAWDIGTTSNSWYIGNGQLELTCRAHRKLVPKYG